MKHRHTSCLCPTAASWWCWWCTADPASPPPPDHCYRRWGDGWTPCRGRSSARPRPEGLLSFHLGPPEPRGVSWPRSPQELKCFLKLQTSGKLLSCQAPGIIGSALGLVGLESVNCDWVTEQAWFCRFLVWLHIKLYSKFDLQFLSVAAHKMVSEDPSLAYTLHVAESWAIKKQQQQCCKLSWSL